jgi:hypothetical protein
MTQAQALLALLGAVFIGLVAIWREPRVTNRATRIRQQLERVVLPLSSGTAVAPTKTVEITARPDHCFRPERLFIAAAGTEGGAADWIVNDIKIAGRSVFSQSGDIPGDMFSSKAIDSFLSFPVSEPGQAVSIVATYIGVNENGVPFYASMVGSRVTKKKPRAKRREKDLVASPTN